ncbi:B/F/G family RNA polymerase sigma-70 factor [Streptomyces sp. SID4944]|nr:B/F/G family RNA polymerase sigma-70 factor [Streptomyces sp. SID4944]
MAEESAYADDPDTAAAFRRLAELPGGPVKERLRAEVICAWLPMAHRLAARYRNRGETLEDLRQVAAIGLVNAVDRYDPAVGRAFAPFAVPSSARIAGHTGLSEEEVRQGSEALHGFSALSIDAGTPPEGGELLLGDRLGAVDEAYDLVLDREAAKPGISRLAEREKRVLYLRFFAGMTQQLQIMGYPLFSRLRQRRCEVRVLRVR